jgi:Flp pilus assembly protein TadD
MIYIHDIMHLILKSGFELKLSKNRYHILLIAFSILVYIPAIMAPFEFDDRERIVENPAIRSLSHIPSFFYSRGPFEGEIYRPLSDSSFAVEYRIWGMNPVGYHVTNTFIHIFNTLMLFILLQQFFHSQRTSFIASLLFAWHPIHTEAVIWIKGRDDLLVTSFYLLALIWHLRGKRIGSLSAFILALLSKEMALTIPIVLPMIDLVKRERPTVKRYLPYAFIAVLYLLARYAILGQVAQTSYWGGGIVQTLYTMSRVTVYYIKLLLFPLNLCLDYLGYPVSKGLLDPYVIPSLIILLLLSALGLYRLFRKRDVIGFSILWFFVTLIPVSNIIPLKILLAERFLYLPSVGLAFFYARMADLVTWRDWRGSTPIILIILSFALLTLEREYIWSSSIRLWEDTVRKMPYNDRAHLNLGSVYMQEGRYPEAIRENNTVLRLNPFDPEAYGNRGLSYASIGETEKAMRDYKTAIMIDPKLPKVRHNMGSLYLQRGERDKGVEEFEREMTVNPNEQTGRSLYELYIILGNEAFEKGDFASAKSRYEKALRLIREEEEAYINLALAYYKMGNRNEAVRVLNDLLKVRPDLTTEVMKRLEGMKR